MQLESGKPSLLGTILKAIVGGALIGIFYLWSIEFTWNGVLISVFTGIAFAFVPAIVFHFLGEQHGIRLVLLVSFAGGLAGILWKYLTNSGVQLSVAGCSGALLALFGLWAEGGFKSKLR